MAEKQQTKVIMISPLGETFTLKTYDQVQIQYNESSRVPQFSLNVRVFDESEMKKFGVGTEVKIYSCSESENINEHLLFKGIVMENPKSLNSIEKNYQIKGLSKVSLTQSILVNEAYENERIDVIVRDLLSKYITTEFNIGYIEESSYTISIKFKDTFLYTALERLADALGYTFELDLDDNFSFFSQSSKTSNKSIKMGDYWKGTASFSEDSTRLVNKLTVYGGKSLSGDITQTIKGDGENSTYLLNYKPRASTSGNIVVTLNDVSQNVGIEGMAEENADCFVSYGEKNIKFIDRTTKEEKKLATSDIVKVTYRYESNLITVVEDKTSFEKFGRKEDLIKFPDITDTAALIDRAKEHLRKYSTPILSGSLSTWKNEHECGSNTKVEIEIDEGYFVNEWLQISEKNITLTPDKINVAYKFEKKKDLSDLLKNLRERIEELEKNNDSEEVQQLDFIGDKVAVTSLFTIKTSKGRGFFIGDKIGGRM